MALTYDTNLATYGTAIAHTTGSGDVTISQPGVYLVEFHADAEIPTGTSVPATATATLNLNGAPVSGAAASQRFTEVDSPANMAFLAAVSVPSGTATLTVTPNEADHSYTNATITVWKIGSTT